MGVKLLKKRLGVTDVRYFQFLMICFDVDIDADIAVALIVINLLQAEAFMREFDTDSDGKLSFTEFQVTMVIRYQRWALNLLKISAVVLKSFKDISGGS